VVREDLGVERVSVVGISGSGKSTLTRRLAERLGCPRLELDAVHHLPGWEPIGMDSFRAEVGEVVTGPRWVVDGNYRAVVPDLVWARADTVVWLDLPRRTVLRRVTWRSLRRVVRREELWNGNRETLATVLSWDPKRSVVLIPRLTPRTSRAEPTRTTPRHTTFAGVWVGWGVGWA
jgi:adenylate kinase family enzyme